MDLDNLQFEDDEKRRQYLADLARLKKYREEAHDSLNKCAQNAPIEQAPVTEEPVSYKENTKQTDKKKKKHPVLVIMLILLILIVGVMAFLYFTYSTKHKGFYTVAVFGVDSRDGSTGKALSDVNMICQVNMETGEIKLVSVYRDTYAQVRKDDYYHKFNEAYFQGGIEMAAWAIETNCDVPVDDYAGFNWKSIVDAINILGGVDVEITDAEFQYINGFITETVNSTGVGSVQLTSPGMQHLDGVQAVAYARLRLMDTDYKRTERQRKIVGLCLDKAKQADISTLKELLLAVLPQINTSVSFDDMMVFAMNISRYYIGDTSGFPYDKTSMDIGKGRTDCVVPVTMESNVIKLHEFLRPEEEYTPSDDVKRISNHIIEVSGQR